MAKPKNISTSNTKNITGKEKHLTQSLQTDCGDAPRPGASESAAALRNYMKLRGEHLGLFPITRYDLDEIVKGSVSKHCLYLMDREGCYLSGFLSYFNWWLELSQHLATDLLCSKVKLRKTKELAHFNRRLRELEVAVLSRFPDAHLAEVEFLEDGELFESETWASSKLSLLKAYRELTLFLCDTAESFWPDENLYWLISHA